MASRTVHASIVPASGDCRPRRLRRLLAAGVAAVLAASTVVVPAAAEDAAAEPGLPPADAGATLSTTAVDPGLQVIVHERGMVTHSVDAAGSTSGSSQLQLVKPAPDATLRRATFFAASTGFSGPYSGQIHLDGQPVAFANSLANDIQSVNYWQDVTDRVRGKVDAAPVGVISFDVAEDDPFSVDGVILSLVFDDPGQTVERSATLLFGATQAEGDQFALNMTEPLDPSQPEAVLEMSLGISFGYQQGSTGQYSVVDVNGQRLTTSAGGEDDGEPSNGALITVGGTGDSPTNPDPFQLPSDRRDDDELYDLHPFVEAGDTSVHVEMNNPSRDDNILFAAFTTNPPVDAFLANQDVLVRLRHDRSDAFFDDAFEPGGSQQVEVVVAPDIEVADVELRVDGVTLGSQTAGDSYVFGWSPASTVTSHTVEATVTDVDGNVSTETRLVYALVDSQGDAVSYLPDNPDDVTDDPNLVKWNAFSADPFTPEAPPLTVEGYDGDYRMVNGVEVVAKSDGTQLVGGHRTDPDHRVGETHYCDDDAVTATTLDSTTDTVSSDGAKLVIDSRLESRVNAVAPDVWGPLKPPGLVGPLGQSESVPSIFSTLRTEVRPDGTSTVELSGDRETGNSWYPMHHAYEDELRIGDADDRPPIDQEAWSITVDNAVSSVIARIPDWAFDAPTFFMTALRAECARQRLERDNPDAYEALHSTWNTLIMMDRLPLVLLPALKPEVWMHMFPVEWKEGRAGPNFTRSPDCQVPGCPGVSKWRWITFRSPVTVHVYDADGRHTGPNPDGTFDHELPDVLHLDDDVATVVRVPDRAGYRVEVEGYDTGLLSIDTGHYNGADRMVYEQYYKLEVHDGSHGVFELGQGLPLRYDLDGDGSYVELVPETRTSDPEPQDGDTLPPVTTVRVNGEELTDTLHAPPARVTLSASDDLAGVYTTDYSLDDGATWHSYTTPFVLEEGEHTLTIQSEDYNHNVETPRTVTIRVGDAATPEVTFEQPVEAAPTVTNVRRGRVLPVKATITNVADNDVISIELQPLASCDDDPLGDPVDGEAPGSANDGNLLRYDADAQQWIFNLATEHLEVDRCYRVELRYGGTVDPATETASGGIVIGSFLLYLRG